MGRPAGRLDQGGNARRARTPDPFRSARLADQLRRLTHGRGRGHRRLPPRPRTAAARRGSPRSGQRCVQVEHRNQDIRKHVAGDEHPAFLNQQRRMARGMGLMLDNPDLRAIPRNMRRLGGQTDNEAEEVKRYLLGDVRRYQRVGDAGLRTLIRQPISSSGRAARRAVAGRCAEPGVPEQVIPMRMRRESCHNGLARIGQVVRQAGHFVVLYPGVDEQHASPALHDNGIALQNSLWWISTPSATCLSMCGSFRLQFAIACPDRSTWW